ncbi:kazrin-like isoform X3 [Apostichopus japonicus]|uniref:kazrin-like isoform X3 n=1 Tax=Stichopus japonicus TaxID=307972 RepID=UPI003AB6CB8D
MCEKPFPASGGAVCRKRASSNHTIVFSIQSLDTLNDQIVQFIFTPKSSECDNNGVDESETLPGPERDTLKSSLSLMRRLLVDAQIKFRRMVDEKEKFASKIGTSLAVSDTNQEVSALRQDLEDKNKGLSGEQTLEDMVTDVPQDNKEWQMLQDEEVQDLREKFSEMEEENKRLKEEVKEIKAVEGTPVDSPPTMEDLKNQLTQKDHELVKVKEAVTIMKNDRKRLKGEKVDLLNQMKQLYCTLEAKEEEMRDFMRNYEERMAESESKLKQVTQEKEEVEKDHWEILKRAREAAERSVTLRNQLDQKQRENENLQEEILKMRKLLMVDMHNSVSMPHITVTSTPVSASQSSLESNSTQDGHVSSNHKGVYNQLPDGFTPPSSARSTQSFMSGKRWSNFSFVGLRAPSTDSESREMLLSAIPISRSTEDCSADGSPKQKKKKKPKKFNSLSKIFGRKNRPLLESIIFDADTPTVSMCSLTTSSQGSVIDLFALQESDKDKLAEECKTLPMMQWKASMVVAWLEKVMCLPEYSRSCAENIKSGQVLLGLSDAEIEAGMGITKPLHKRKLRLAIEDHKYPNQSFPNIANLDHQWVCKDWLKDIGLSQYSTHFENERIDGRVLNTLTRKDLDKLMNITRKFHQVTILHGVELLRLVEFDKRVLTERRAQCDDIDCDPLVWSTQRLIKWTENIDLKEYADNLEDSGVHGALLVLERSFDADAVANALGIPSSKTIIRRHLTTELNALIRPARTNLESILNNNKEDARSRKSSTSSNSSNKSFQRSYRGPNDSKSKPTFRGSLGRALGRKMRHNMEKHPGLMFSDNPEKMRAKSRSQDLSNTTV